MTWLRRRWPIALALVLVYLDDDANPYRRTRCRSCPDPPE